MWIKITRLLLKNRLAIFLLLAVVTVVMAFFATRVELHYEFARLLPGNDSTFVTHENFKKTFGQDGNIIIIASEGVDIYQKENFRQWYKLGEELRKMRGVDSVFSVAHLYNLQKNNEERKFELKRVIDQIPSTQEEVDSIKLVVESLPFYHGLIYDENEKLSIMMVFVNQELFNSKKRGTIVSDIKSKTEEYAETFTNFRYSGLPYIRSVTMDKVQSELRMFVLLALLVTSILIYVLFRSFKVVLVSLIVVAVGVTWAVGVIGIFEYKITVLMGLIPPLVIVIGIPNCIYIINKYQQEFLIHGNKTKALARVIQKIGTATFMTNATTAMGFATFIFTYSEILREFGVVASINIILLFVLSIILVPIFYSYLPDPKEKHTKHLEKKWLNAAVEGLVRTSSSHRKIVFVVTALILLLGIYGISKMHTTGNIVDDLPNNDPILVDLQYFEKNFGGVMPFEIIIDAKRKDRIFSQDANLYKIENIQHYIESHPEFSRSFSVVDALKFLNQAYANGTEEHYRIKSQSVHRKVFNYLEGSSDSTKMGTSFLDSTRTKTRISVQVADIGTERMESLISRIEPVIDSILNPDQENIQRIYEKFKTGINDPVSRDSALTEMYYLYPEILLYVEENLAGSNATIKEKFLEDENFIFTFHDRIEFEDALLKAIEDYQLDFVITGTSVVFTKGTNYLVNNLLISLILAIFVIAVLMSTLFRSVLMVFISLTPNLIPLIVTAALMGYFGISIKPSTILVFSIAFGISVDDTIHYLAKFKQELRIQNWDVGRAAIGAIRETGASMIYTSLVLFFGFSIFIASNFGGTQALGILVSITLLVAMLANLVLLPSLLLSLEKRLTIRAFKQSRLDVVDSDSEEGVEDIEEEEKTNPE
ncbi:MAG: efflux RND transporter permease subunit [Flavobacteriales bacterium]